MARDLGQRALACPHWQWLAGSLRLGGSRLTKRGGPWTSGIPDLTDPATLGCLLALVREAWGDKSIYVKAESDPRGRHTWEVWSKDGPFKEGDGLPLCWAWGWSEAEALVAALEAAPEGD